MIQVPQFATKKELQQWLVQNKTLLETQKKAAVKRGDICVHVPQVMGKLAAAKEDGNDASQNISTLQVESIINTTNVLDSHYDVHIPGIWDKCLKEQKNFYLIEAHELTFDNIISDEVKAATKQFSFKELGVDVAGNTEALLFTSVIKSERNEKMFKHYRNGWVKNHSVGMRYVKLYMCIDSEEAWATQEKDNWDKYYPMILVNKEAADAYGYFWAVTEAKVIEGSAVPIGSNQVTPTYSVTESKAADGTLNNPEPVTTTQPAKAAVNWDNVLAALQKN